MKDLYRRNGLRPREADPVKIHGASGSAEEREAAFTILLNAEKKREYDAAHLALSRIGYLRRHTGLTGSWRSRYGDFLEPGLAGNAGSGANRRTRWSLDRALGWLLITLVVLAIVLPLIYLLISLWAALKL